jgi:DNA-binding NarL/FixJ family response regulator
MASPIRVLQIEDNPADARLIRELIAEESSIGFTWKHVERLSTATDILRVQPFDLVLLDLSLPDSQGLETLNRLQPHASSVPIVVLTGLDNELLGMQAVRAGAQDYLVKGKLDGERLVQVLRYAIERKRSENVHRARIERHGADPSPRLIGSPITINSELEILLKNHSHREIEMLQLIAEGVTNREMAKRLSVSLRTVERCRAAIMRRVGLQNRAELIAYARQIIPSGEDTNEFE